MDQIKIGSFLKELRKDKNLTQEQLAEQFHVASRTVSRWENGNNMPDLSVLVELADFYDVSIRELIDGERKSENMTEGVKEIVERVAEYSKTTNKKKIARIVLLMFIPIVVLSVLLVILFSSRSMQIFPDSYPAYPQVYIDKKITDTLINNYIVDHMTEPSDGGNNFASIKVFSTEEKQSGDYYVYAWVLESSYSYNSEVLTEETASSYPCRFELIRENDSFRIVNADVPRDGDYNVEDRKKLFPGYVVEMIERVQEDGTVTRLADEIFIDAKEYFNVK